MNAGFLGPGATLGDDMVDVSTATLVPRPAMRPKLDRGAHPSMAIAFVVLLIGGVLFTAYSLYTDIESASVQTATWIPFLFLGLALFIALGFEFDKKRARLNCIQHLVSTIPSRRAR